MTSTINEAAAFQDLNEEYAEVASRIQGGLSSRAHAELVTNLGKMAVSLLSLAAQFVLIIPRP